MTILQVVYASRPPDEVIIPTLEIQIEGQEPLRLCADYVNHWLAVDGVYHEFTATAMDIALPAKNATGQQTLRFGVTGVRDKAQRLTDEAIESGQRVRMIYRAYLASDKSAPAERPRTLYVDGNDLVGDDAVFEGSYYDLLNTAWPRERYTAETAPGIRYA